MTTIDLVRARSSCGVWPPCENCNLTRGYMPRANHAETFFENPFRGQLLTGKQMHLSM